MTNLEIVKDDTNNTNIMNNTNNTNITNITNIINKSNNTKKIVGRIEDICEDNEFEFFINGKAIDNLIDHCIYKYTMTDINESELLCKIFEDRCDYIDNLENYIEKTFEIKIDLLNWVTDCGEYSENELYKSINITGYKTFIKQKCLQLIKK